MVKHLAAFRFGWLIVLPFTLSCGRSSEQSSLNLDPLSQEQVLEDFDAIVNAFKGLYGPLEYKAKQPTVKLDFGAAVKKTRDALAASKSDAEAFGLYSQFLRTFRDGHVGIKFPLSDKHITKYTLPLFVMPLQDDAGVWHAIVDSVGDQIKDSGLKEGDEVTHVDGKPIFDYLPLIQKYKSYSNDVSDQHLIFKVFSRDFFMYDLVPQSSLAQVSFLSAGSNPAKNTFLTWNKELGTDANPDIIKTVAANKVLSVDTADRDALIRDGSIQKMGAAEPFFATAQVKAKFNPKIRKPSAASLKKFGLEEKDATPIFAATYEYQGKDILLIRQPGYSPPFEGNQDDEDLMRKAMNNWIQTYKAILFENEDVDVLVIDQTHNPGGLSTYVDDFFRLFITSQKANLIQRNNVDRKWVIGYLDEAKKADKRGKPAEARRFRAFAKMVEDAGERHELLSPAMTFDYDFLLTPHDDYSWKKPMLVLADELAGSCGDIFPMLMKSNGVAKVFGQRTMGLGGNVETLTLTHSQATLRLTRGLFTTYRQDGVYPDEGFVENNGVAPDIRHELKVNDYRAGFVGYVDAFSKAAIGQL